MAQAAGSPRAQHLAPLTGLRFAAASAVVIFHVMLSSIREAGAHPWLQTLFSRGFVAVGFFFVLSGFILAYTYLDEDRRGRDSAQFWTARVARIYPLYLFSLLLSLGMFVDETSGGRGGQLATVVVAGTAVVTMTQAWLPQTALRWNLPAWSLSVEAFFYAVFPFLGPRLARLSNVGLASTALAVWLLGLAVPGTFYAAAAVTDGLANNGLLRAGIAYNPLAHLPQFVVGLASGVLFLRFRGATSHRFECSSTIGGLLSSFALIALLVLLISGSGVPDLFLQNGVLAPLFAVLIFGAALGGGPVSWLFSRPLIVLLGEASYATYLLHICIWTSQAAAARHYFGLTEEQIHAPLFLAVYCGVLLFASVASVYCIERPARRLIREWAGQWFREKGSLLLTGVS